MVLTLLQQDIRWHAPATNRQRIEQLLQQAPPSDLLLLPETFTTGFGGDMTATAEYPGEDTEQWLLRMAREHDALVSGTWIVINGDKAYNRMHWAMPDGTIGHYDKAHTFRPSIEHTLITPGSECPIIRFRGWNIRPAICYDLRFPRWLRNDDLQYDLLLLPANWPTARRDAWTTLLKARAIENVAYVAGCNRCGIDPDNVEYAAPSAIIDFKGKVLQEATGEQLITAELSIDKLRDFRQRWPFHLDFDHPNE